MSMELLKEIRGTEEKARSLIEQAKMDAESTVVNARERAKKLISDARNEGEKQQQQTFEESKKIVEEENILMEKKFEESIQQHRNKFLASQDKAVKIVLDSILSFEAF